MRRRGSDKMKRGTYLLLGMILIVTALVLADYLLKLRIYEKLTADPCLLKSPNECESLNAEADQ
jgi:hypothetical protein